MNQIKKLNKEASFFQPSKFKSFSADIRSLKVQLQAKAIHQLNLKCYGYGYFDEQTRSIQSELKQNFLIYLEQALTECTGLRILKLQFSGFSIADRSLIKIISQIELLVERREIEVLWFHTRLLRDCQAERINEILSLTDRMIGKNKVEEISLQLAGWEFKQGPPEYWDLVGRFHNFATDLMEEGYQTIKRFRLDLSSLYVSQLQAYNFLKMSIPTTTLVKMIQQAKLTQDRTNSVEPAQSVYSDKVRRYITNIDHKYEIEHPIPGKSKFISRQPEYQRRKKEYIQERLRNGVNQADLLLVFKEERSMPEEHKVALKKIRQEVDRDMEDQAKRIEQGEQLIKQTAVFEKEISQNLVKFPFDFVMAQRIQHFHQRIKIFVKELHSKLRKMQQFELDMRNWSNVFQMAQLKKTLLKEITQGGLRPNLNSASKIVNKVEMAELEQGPRNKCKFIM